MEIHERIRELRKKHLHLTQSEFGEKLGVSRAVIKNIELNVLAKPEQKLSLIKLMCKEFSVNEDWLLNGNEPMFVKPDAFSLDSFAKEYGCTELEFEILRAYFEIDQETRLAVVNHFKERLTAVKAQGFLADKAPALVEPEPDVSEDDEDAMRRLAGELYVRENRKEKKPAASASFASESAAG